MKHIYLVFVATDNIMGRLIRCFTGHVFSHAAISLDDSLVKMYSFARRQKRSPLVGGFVVETPSRYFDSTGPVPLKIAEITLDEVQYRHILSTLADFEKRQEELIYNSVDAVLSLFGAHARIRDSHTCFSFVAYALSLSKVGNVRDLEVYAQNNVIFNGDIRDYIKAPYAENPFYFARLKLWIIAAGTIRHFCRLFARSVTRGK
ncbi:MAG: hypothetical protein FWE66_03580 [Oscillospiraceae bacterium]|nr:hypothetical protein [Oscillospiraceae bacterium]